MGSLLYTGQGWPAAYQALERSNNQSSPNHYHDSQQDGYRPSLGNQDTDGYRTERRGAGLYDPTFHDQYAQAYFTQTSYARPTNAQYRPHVDRHDFDYQQFNPRHIEDSETSSTAAVVGSRAPESVFVPPRPYHDFRTTAQTGESYTQPAHIRYQQEPLMKHRVPYDWTTRPTSGGYNGPSCQHGGHVQHLMSQGAPLMPSPGPIPTPYNRPQAWVDPAQSMQIHPPAMYGPAPTLMPTNYSGVPIQPPSVNTLHPAVYQSYPQLPATAPPGDLSNNTVNQDQYSRANSNETMVNPRSIAPGATRPRRKNHRGNGRGNGKERAEGRSEM